MKIFKKIGDFLRPKIQKIKLFFNQTYYNVKTKTKTFISSQINAVKSGVNKAKDFVLGKINGVISYILINAGNIKRGAINTINFVIRVKEFIVSPLREFYSDIQWKYNRAYIKFYLTKRLRREVERVGLSQSLNMLKAF